MAKKGKVTKLKTRKGKKKWFPVKAPKIYKSKDLPQVTAYEPAELVGRMIMINMKEITGSGRDSNTRAKFEIVKVQGDTAMTESRGFFVNDAQVSRVGRKAVTRIESVFYVNDKNGTKIKFKIMPFLNKAWEIISINDKKVLRNFKKWKLFSGDIIRSTKPGKVLISNPNLNKSILLDFSNKLVPKIKVIIN